MGGYAIVAGCMLPWLVTGGVNIGPDVVSGTPAGMEFSGGLITLVSGIVVILAATLMMLVPRSKGVLAVGVVLAGLTGASGTVPTLADPRESYIRFVADDLGRSADEVRNSLEALFDIGGIRDTLGEGLYLTLGGAGLSIIGGAVGGVSSRRRRIRARGQVTSRDEVKRSPTRTVPSVPADRDTQMAPAEEPVAGRPSRPDEAQPLPRSESIPKRKAPPPSDVDEWR